MAKKKAAAKAEKSAGYVFSATIEVEGKEVAVNYQFKRKQFLLKKKLILVADLFDANGAAKEESGDLLAYLIEINSGIIQKID